MHASRIEAIGHAACWSSHLFRHVAGSVASPLHMMEDRKIQWRLGGDAEQSLRERFSPVTHSRLWVSPPSSCDFYSLGSMQGAASWPITTHPGRKGREAGGRQRDTEETISTDSRNGASLLTLCYLAADCCTTAETMKGACLFHPSSTYVSSRTWHLQSIHCWRGFY